LRRLQVRLAVWCRHVLLDLRLKSREYALMYPVFRIFYQSLLARKQPAIGFWDTHVSHHTCLPWDIDLWMELNNGLALTARNSVLKLVTFLLRPADFRDFAVLLDNFETLLAENRVRKSINVFFALHPDGEDGLELSISMEPWRLRVRLYSVRTGGLGANVPGQEIYEEIFVPEDEYQEPDALRLISKGIRILEEHPSFAERKARYFCAEYFSNEELKHARG